MTPMPAAEFSAFATTRSSPSRAMRRGTSRCTAWRPGFPKTSPRKRTFKGPGSGSARRARQRDSRREPGARASVTSASSGASCASRGSVGDELESKATPMRAARGIAGERRVVVAAAAAEPVAVLGERDPRHQDAVDRVDRGPRVRRAGGSSAPSGPAHERVRRARARRRGAGRPGRRAGRRARRRGSARARRSRAGRPPRRAAA